MNKKEIAGVLGCVAALAVILGAVISCSTVESSTAAGSGAEAASASPRPAEILLPDTPTPASGTARQPEDPSQAPESGTLQPSQTPDDPEKQDSESPQPSQVPKDPDSEPPQLSASPDEDGKSGESTPPEGSPEPSASPSPGESGTPEPEPSDTPPAQEPPEVTDEYSIVTGTSGEFTPGDMVDDSWFDDVLFIGDSRTDGLRLFSRTGGADYFASTGLTVFSALTKEASDNHFSSQTLPSLLESKTYGKIFLCLGINECGSSHQKIIDAYQKLVNTVAEKQPDAEIIVQAILACGRGKAASNSCFGPENLNKLNASIRTMAENSGAYYIDPNTLFADEEGYLPDALSNDGCHFHASSYSVWMDWIKCQVYQLIGA